MSLLVWLPFNGTLENKSNSNTVITNNGATVNNNGKPGIGQCYSFNGSSNFITVTNCIPTLSFSVCCWVYFNSVASNMTIATCRKAVGNGIAIFQLDQGTIRFDLGSTTDTSTSKILVANKWTHICVTYNGTNKNVYLDGVLIQSLTKSKTTIEDLSTLGWSIGASQASAVLNGSSNYLNGQINDFRIYNTCLNIDEIQSIYNYYNPKKYLYKFDTLAIYKNYIKNDINCPYNKLQDVGKVWMSGEYGNTSNPSYLCYGKNNFKFIEYIETHSRQRYPHWMIPNDNKWKFECVFEMLNVGTSAYAMWFGTYDSEAANSYRVIKNNTANNSLLVNAYTKTGGGGTAVGSSLNTKYKITIYYNSCIVYNYTTGATTTTTLGTTQGTSILTRMWVGTTHAGQIGKYYMFNTYYDNELVSALRPIKDSSGYYGFFDLMKGVVIYNTEIVNENNYTLGSE